MLSQNSCMLHSPRNRRPGLSLASFIWLLAFVSAGLWLLLPSAKERQNPSAEVSAQLAELASFHQATSPHYRNIDQIRVGQRVVTPEASSAEGLPTAVDPLTWKKLTLQAKARWEGGTIDDIEVQTLQPSSWLELHQAVVGASVPIPLDLREMGLPQMNATVMAIDPCPVIEEGPGRVVLTTVNHLNRFLFDLTVHGKRGPPQAVEVTGWHKLFSEDRQAWTSVCELHLGEVLRGREGELTVTSLDRHPGVQRVYNLTVEEEHQYYVSFADLLAHNANCMPRGDKYSVAFETELDSESYPGVSRARHFQEANENLLQMMEADPAFEQTMRQAGVNLQRTPKGLAPRTPPAGWTWHHAQEAGVMQLVPSAQHTPGSIFWDTMHPGGRGGYAIWGTQ